VRALLAIGLGLGLWSLAAMWADAATLPGPLAVAAALLEA
jgi:ABC-type nitrate/sulfonate/bicarbonate transport system permease component